MRAATTFERTRTPAAPASSHVFAAGVAVVGLLLALRSWLWPNVSVVAGLILLAGLGWHIASLRRKVCELSDRDPLTGAASRAFFLDRLRRAVEQGNRCGGPVAVAVLDCDDFKHVNEQYGHSVGDTVLIEVADVLSQALGHIGTVGRIWGDAFGIVLPGATPETARSLLREAEERLQGRMRAHDWPVTFSIGISCEGGRIATADRLLADADAMMFAIKRRGRNGIACRDLKEDPSAVTKRPSPEFARQP